jgi:hypothetical protein
MPDPAHVDPTPDLADVPMKPAPDPGSVDAPDEVEGTDPHDPPAEDVTLPTE